MATRPETVTYLLEVMAGAGAVTVRKMFGEYAVYLDGKVVGLICDNQLFLKPVPAARALLPHAALATPYPGVKPKMALDGELDDPDLVAAAMRAIAATLPAAKPAKPAGRGA